MLITGTMPKLDPQFIIPFAKPSGMTSFSSLWQVKKAFGTKKVGHTGTLDSFADGLLVLLSGKLTKLVPYITDFDKTYRTLFYFGKETDTLDPEGTVIAKKPLPVYADFLRAVAALTGTLQQIPPVYSAVKQNGERLSDKMRRGETVTAAPRTVRVYSSVIEKIFFEDGSEYTAENTFSSAGKHTDGLDVGEYAAKKVSGAVLRVHCSKGTYIRSLVRDIAHLCGSASFVYALRRTAVGPFTLEQAAGFSALPPFGNTVANLADADSIGTAPKSVHDRRAGQDGAGVSAELSVTHPVSPEELKQAALPLSASLARDMHFQTAVLHEAFYPAFIAGRPIRSCWFSCVEPFTDGSTIAVFYQDNCAGLITKKESRFAYGTVFAQNG